MSVMVFVRCGRGGPRRLFMCCLSQDWTFVCQQSLCWPIRTPIFLLAPPAVIGPTTHHSCSWFVTAFGSLCSESLVSSSLSLFSSIRVECEALQVFCLGVTVSGHKNGLKWKHYLNIIHTCFPFHFAFLCVCCLKGDSCFFFCFVKWILILCILGASAMFLFFCKCCFLFFGLLF